MAPNKFTLLLLALLILFAVLVRKADVYNPPKDSLKIPTDKQMNGPLPEPKN